MIQLRPFQNNMIEGCYARWGEGHTNVVLVAPTGAGKTVIMAAMCRAINAPMCAIAHKQELVQQISLAMATMGLFHNIVAPEAVVKVVISQHIEKLGNSFYDRRANLTVASINTLNSRAGMLKQWANTVKYWFGDECHHFLEDNQWGKGVKLFPQAKGVGFTASPLRCDRKSLHRAQGGIFDTLVEGPSMRDLINQGYLSDYRIFAPPQSIDRASIKRSKATGDFSHPSLRAAVEQSTITGDIVETYCKLTPGARGITFTVDIKSALKTAQAYRDAGVPAEAVSSKTPDVVRNNAIRAFQRGDLLQLVNVDLFGEGFDVPAVEVVSMGRPTESVGLFIQQFGRALRTADGKLFGTILDHVGNVKRHGLPDMYSGWSLFGERYSKSGGGMGSSIPVTSCLSCFRAYEAVTKTCPHCGHVHEPDSRSEPKFVDGDLVEFSPELLAELRGEIGRIDGEVRVPTDLLGTPAAGRIARTHGERQLAQEDLRGQIALWAGVQKGRGRGDSEIHRRFYHTFGTDVLTAQTLKTAAAIDLSNKIQERMFHE